MKLPNFILGIISACLVILLGYSVVMKNNLKISATNPSTETAAVKPVSSEISADGSITAQTEATLHFQTGGKLTYLPFKEGDAVSQGQTIAQLDTYALQRQLTQALNTYQSTRDAFDQTQQNAQDNVLQTQQAPTQANAQIDKSNAVNDAVKRIVDENQTNLNTSVVNVELANYAVQLATLTSPLTGIVTHEDVTVPYQSVTPLTSFTVADPSTMIFRANISDSDITYVSEGASATIMMNGSTSPINGTISKIYPAKIILNTGQKGYQVDITSDGIKSLKMDQVGTVLIKNNVQENVMVVPVWTVIGGKYIWIENNNQPELKTVTVGKTHGDMMEVLGGLSSADRVITDPKTIPARYYQLL